MPDLCDASGVPDRLRTELVERVGGGTESHYTRSGDRHEGEKHDGEHEEQSPREGILMRRCRGTSSKEGDRAHILHIGRPAAALIGRTPGLGFCVVVRSPSARGPMLRSLAERSSRGEEENVG
jgi:hypothetical protein